MSRTNTGNKVDVESGGARAKAEAWEHLMGLFLKKRALQDALRN